MRERIFSGSGNVKKAESRTTSHDFQATNTSASSRRTRIPTEVKVGASTMFYFSVARCVFFCDQIFTAVWWPERQCGSKVSNRTRELLVDEASRFQREVGSKTPSDSVSPPFPVLGLTPSILSCRFGPLTAFAVLPFLVAGRLFVVQPVDGDVKVAAPAAAAAALPETVFFFRPLTSLLALSLRLLLRSAFLMNISAHHQPRNFLPSSFRHKPVC